jgi:hypothetical protein
MTSSITIWKMVLHICIAIPALIASFFSFLEMDQLPFNWNYYPLPSQHETNSTSGRVVRNWQLFVLGLANSVSFLCEIVLALIYCTPLIFHDNSHNVLPQTLFNFFRYLPTVLFLSFFSIITIYFVELALNQSNEFNISNILMYWQLLTIVIFIIFMATLLIPSLQLVFYWCIFVEFSIIFLVVALAGQYLLAKLPRIATITSRSSIVTTPIHRRLLPLYLTCLVATGIDAIYHALIATGSLPRSYFS